MGRGQTHKVHKNFATIFFHQLGPEGQVGEKKSQCRLGVGVGAWEHEVSYLHGFTNSTATSIYFKDPFCKHILIMVLVGITSCSYADGEVFV